MNSKDQFVFNFVFDLWYIVAAFSMFLCLLGEVVSYLFYSKRPTEIKLWISPRHISPQGTKRSAGKRLQHKYRPVNVAEFLRTHLFKNTSADCFWRWTRWNQTTAQHIPIERLFSLNDSLWMILATRRNKHVVAFSYSRRKVKMRQKING